MTVNQQGPAVDADAFSAFEASGWDRQAPSYVGFFGRVTSRLVGPLLDAAGVGSGSRMLDLATGPGYAAAEAAGRGAAVVGVDVAPGMVALARRLHPSLDFREADAEALPFADGTFTAAVSNFVIPHLARHGRAVGELVRVLGGGAKLAMTTWDFPDRMRLIGVFLDAFAEAGATPPDGIPAGPPFFRYSGDEELAGLLADGGLTGVRVDTIAFDQRVATADELWDGVVTGTVRTSAMIMGQPEQTRQRVRAAFDRLVMPYRRGDHFEFPVSVKIGHGRKAD